LLVSTLVSNTWKASSSVGSLDDLARISCEIEEKYLSRVLVLTRARKVGFLVGILPGIGQGKCVPSSGSEWIILVN
jgi:hypothetical protein